MSEAQQAFLDELLSEPFSDGRGEMAILAGDSLEAAEDLYRESPVVRSAVAAVDLHGWNVLLGSTWQ